MTNLLVFEVETFKVFVLVLARVGGLVASAPILGSRNFPTIGKIGLSGLLAALIVPTLPALPSTLPSDPIGFATLGASELLIGLMIGLAMTFVFGAIQVGGQIMDMQSGFGMMNVFNPALEAQAPIFGFFFFILAVLFLLLTNGHHLMIRGLVATFDRIPLGGFAPRPALLLEASRWGEAMFVDGLMMAAPVAVAMLLAYVVMGLLGRAVPQIQLFVVGFPLTIATALVVVAFSIDMYLWMLDGMFDRMFRNVSVMIRGMT